jgi:hypothetical protein
MRYRAAVVVLVVAVFVFSGCATHGPSRQAISNADRLSILPTEERAKLFAKAVEANKDEVLKSRSNKFLFITDMSYLQDKDILQVKGYIKAQEYADAVFIPYKTPEARNYAIFNDIRNAVCVSDDRPMIDLGMRVQYTITDKNEGVIINETIDAASCR